MDLEVAQFDRTCQLGSHQRMHPGFRFPPHNMSLVASKTAADQQQQAQEEHHPLARTRRKNKGPRI